MIIVYDNHLERLVLWLFVIIGFNNHSESSLNTCLDEQVRASGMRNSVSRAWATNRSEYFTCVALSSQFISIHLIPGTKINMVSVLMNIVCSGVTSKNSVCASETVTLYDLNENELFVHRKIRNFSKISIR